MNLREQFNSKFTIEGKGNKLACAESAKECWNWINDNYTSKAMSDRKPLIDFFQLIYNLYLGGDLEIKNSKQTDELLSEFEKLKQHKPYIGTRR